MRKIADRSGAMTAAILLPAAMLTGISTSRAQQGSVITYHGDPARTGNFVVPGLTWDKARSLHPDPGFDARFSDHVYAQPLYWQPPGSGTRYADRRNGR